MINDLKLKKLSRVESENAPTHFIGNQIYSLKLIFCSQWKRLWQLVSGINFETPTKIVNEQLSSVAPQLLDGLKQFNTNKPESDQKLKDILKKSGQERLQTFTQKLQQYLVRFLVESKFKTDHV